MAKILKNTKGYHTELFDSDTGKACITEKVVDVTEDCPMASHKKRVILLFTRAKRGRIVKILRSCLSIHFFVDELDREFHVAPCRDTFGSWAEDLGLTKVQLRSLIETHAPAI